jgi:hypothetical protein
MVFDIEPSHLEDLEYLISQSRLGVHHLFDRELLVGILIHTSELDLYSFENIDRVQQIVSDFIARPSFIDKRYYIESLDPEDFAVLVRAYFNLVENSILRVQEYKH